MRFTTGWATQFGDIFNIFTTGCNSIMDFSTIEAVFTSFCYKVIFLTKHTYRDCSNNLFSRSKFTFTILAQY